MNEPCNIDHENIADIIILTVLLAGCGAFFIFLPQLPFQDFPQHAKILELSQALGENHGYLEKPDRIIFSYNLYVWLYKAVSAYLLPGEYLRWLLIITGLAIPLSLFLVLRAVGRRGAWAAILATPLIFSWPLKIGFIPYLLGIPFVFLSMAAMVQVCRSPGLKTHMALAGCLLFAYLSHALTYGLACLAAAAVWLFLARSNLKLTASIAAAFAVTWIPVAVDLAGNAFSPVDGVGGTLHPVPMQFRPLSVALGHFVTRTYGVAGFQELFFLLPLLAVLAAGVAGSVLTRQWSGSETARVIPFAAGFAFLGCLVVPESKDYLFYLASRLGILFVALLTCVAAPFWTMQKAWIKAIALAAVVLAIGINMVTIHSNAAVVGSVLGPGGPEPINGTFLTARVDACMPYENKWGRYDPLRHIALAALDHNGVTPYLFAWNRYHPVQYRGERFKADLLAPSEHINSYDSLGTSSEAANGMRIWSVGSWASSHGSPHEVLLFGTPSVLSEYLPGASRWGSVKLLSPGIARLTPYKRRPLPKKVTIHVGTYGGARFLEGGWSYVEYRFGRWVRWSETRESTVVFDIEPSAGEYVVMLHGAPHGGILDQHVLLTLNGRKLGEGAIPLRKGFSVVSVRFPGDWLEPEGNTLILSHHRDVPDQGHFPRRLSVLYESIRILPVNPR